MTTDNDILSHVISTGRQQINSNRRKLPELPCKRHHQTFWSTFRGAIQRMKQHKDSLETAFDLCNIHPKLMKNKACDTFHELMSNSALSSTMDSVGNCKLATGSTHNAQQNNCRIKLPDAPTISVPYDSVNEKTSLNDRPVESIFVCGINVRDKWTKVILDLCQGYFVRCTNADGDDNRDEVLKAITNSDVFIFLMDDQSLSSRKCLSQLDSALRCNARVIFIRESNLKKPSNHDMYKWPDNEQDQHLRRYSNSELFLDNKTVTSKNIKSINGSQIVFVPQDFDGANQLYVKESNNTCVSATQTIVRKEGSYSAPDLNDIDRLSKKPTINGRVESPRSSRTSPTRFPSSMSAKTDVASMVEQGYFNAFIYDRHRHCDVLINLKTILNKKTNAKHDVETKRKFVAIPTPCNDRTSFSDNSTVSEMDISLSPEPDCVKDKNCLKDDLDSVEQLSQDTVYLIFTNEREKTPPKIFHWPSDYVNENKSVSNSPSIESFGFEDVDLSKRINNFEIFSSSESD